MKKLFRNYDLEKLFWSSKEGVSCLGRDLRDGNEEWIR
jgi:hypothetical protein